MAKAGRHQELLEILGRELDADPVGERRRAEAQVDGHIEDAADRAAHELGHGRPLILVVQSAQHAVLGARVIVLDKVGRQAEGGELLFVGRSPGKIPAHRRAPKAE